MSTDREENLIFISWSGETSRQVAQALRELLQNSIQPVNPWMSEPDMEKGVRWQIEIEKKIEDAIAGVAVVTQDNQEAPWLLFESGALSKKREQFYTYLFRVQKGSLKEPLARFNATSANSEETLEMLKSINRQLGAPSVKEETMVKAFGHNWRDFEIALNRVSEPSDPAPAPSELQMVLSYIRELSSELAGLKNAWSGNESVQRLTSRSLSPSTTADLDFEALLQKAIMNPANTTYEKVQAWALAEYTGGMRAQIADLQSQIVALRAYVDATFTLSGRAAQANVPPQTISPSPATTAR